MSDVLTALAVVMATVCILIQEHRTIKLEKRVKELEIFYEAVKVVLAKEELIEQEENSDA